MPEIVMTWPSSCRASVRTKWHIGNIENAGVEPVNLLALTPRLPDGVDLIAVKDFAAELEKVRHERLGRELSVLLRGNARSAGTDTEKMRAGSNLPPALTSSGIGASVPIGLR